MAPASSTSLWVLLHFTRCLKFGTLSNTRSVSKRMSRTLIITKLIIRNYWNYAYRPFYHHCDFCDVKYDAIVFMETYDEELRTLHTLRKSWTSRHSWLTQRRGKIRLLAGSKWSQSERIKANFSLLDKDAKQSLYQLYRMDFEMFRFDASSYLW